MSIKGNLQNKVYADRRTGVKRRWMEYWKVNRWLSVKNKDADWGPALVAAFSILLALLFFAIANEDIKTDALTPMEDRDNDKQFDNPWNLNDGRFTFTLGNTYAEPQNGERYERLSS